MKACFLSMQNYQLSYTCIYTHLNNTITWNIYRYISSK